MERATKVKTRELLFRVVGLIKPHLCNVHAFQQLAGNLTLLQKTNPDIPTKAGLQSPRKKHHTLDESIINLLLNNPR